MMHPWYSYRRYDSNKSGSKSFKIMLVIPSGSGALLLPMNFRAFDILSSMIFSADFLSAGG